ATNDDLNAINQLELGEEETSTDETLRAQQRKADAAIEFHRSIIAYNLAIKNVHFQKGSLLQYNGVLLAEGPWSEQAHMDAQARSHYFHPRHIDYRTTRPGIISRGTYQQEQQWDDSSTAGPNAKETIRLPPPETPIPPPE
ncbi:MAG: hypothetical protein N2C12_16250, partial [Planctomycetales bacterium]